MRFRYRVIEQQPAESPGGHVAWFVQKWAAPVLSFFQTPPQKRKQNGAAVFDFPLGSPSKATKTVGCVRDLLGALSTG